MEKRRFRVNHVTWVRCGRVFRPTPVHHMDLVLFIPSSNFLPWTISGSTQGLKWKSSRAMKFRVMKTLLLPIRAYAVEVCMAKESFYPVIKGCSSPSLLFLSVGAFDCFFNAALLFLRIQRNMLRSRPAVGGGGPRGRYDILDIP